MSSLIIGIIITGVIAALIAYGVTTLIDHEKKKTEKLKQIAKELEKINKNTPE